MSVLFIQPYLFFGGRCQEAINFYREVLNAEVEMVMLFKDSPEPLPAEVKKAGFEEKVMHASFRVGNHTIMASDGCDEGSGFEGFSLSLTFSNADDVKKVFEGLSNGGKITMPLAATFWSPLYGMLIDRFGISWMVSILPVINE